MLIKSERAKMTEYCGNVEFDSEVEVLDGEKTTYIHAHYGHDCPSFLASTTSIFEEMEKDASDAEPLEYIEEYSEINETDKSKYTKYYRIAERMFDDMADSYNEHFNLE